MYQSLDPAELRLNDPPSIIWITVADAFGLLWEANPKAHDLEKVKDSIARHGFQELPKFDPAIGIKAGNGRVEAVTEMERDGRPLPRGLALTRDGRWAVPLLVGTDAESKAAASAYALDSNNLVLLGGDFSPADLLRLYNPGAFLAVVNEIAAEEEYAVSVPASAIGGLVAAYEKIEGTAAAPEEGRVVPRNLIEQFVIPPYSILDARQGYWQKRKKAWHALGIHSKLGRDDEEWEEGKAEGLTFTRTAQTTVIYGLRNRMRQELGRDPTWTEIIERAAAEGYTLAPGTSVFDPVLCEIVYTWFSAEGGAILDPFAGGSVRGLVAGYLGRAYTGIDLRPEQVAANQAQAEAVNPAALQQQGEATVAIKVSAKMARLPFNGCQPDYIREVCRAACCRSTTEPAGVLITIHPSEIAVIEAQGGTVVDGRLQPKAHRCPFEAEDHLCQLHGTAAKPFGCRASPFTLNSNGTLIVRNRYRLLKCYNDGRKLPAYRAFRSSLDAIFGEAEAARICRHLDEGGDDIVAYAPRRAYQMLLDNDAIKKGQAIAAEARPADAPFVAPRWIVGNSLTAIPDEEYDLIFSCPPYYDLEVYSGQAGDLSAYPTYEKFLADYGRIIAQAAARLRPNRFACFVVGDIRDKAGNYRNFVADTIAAFRAAGLALYNEAILVTAIGNLPTRVVGPFEKSRKLGKAHQNVLIFVKGDGRLAAEWCGPVKVSIEMEETDEFN